MLAVAETEVTVAEWHRCFAAGGCSHSAEASAARRATPDNYPVVGVNWFDVGEYLGWINRRTGRRLALPTLAEWQALASGVIPEPTAAAVHRSATCLGCGLQSCDAGPGRGRPAGSFSVTSAGLYDLDGNVWEWTADCAAEGFTAPTAPVAPPTSPPACTSPRCRFWCAIRPAAAAPPACHRPTSACGLYWSNRRHE